MKTYGSTLLALRGGWAGVEFPEKKHYVTLEWRCRKQHSRRTFGSNARSLGFCGSTTVGYGSKISSRRCELQAAIAMVTRTSTTFDPETPQV